MSLVGCLATVRDLGLSAEALMVLSVVVRSAEREGRECAHYIARPALDLVDLRLEGSLGEAGDVRLEQLTDALAGDAPA